MATGFVFGRVEVRLQGIAAPEWNRHKRVPGGEEAYEALRAVVEGREIKCLLDGTTASSNRLPASVWSKTWILEPN